MLRPYYKLASGGSPAHTLARTVNTNISKLLSKQN